MLRCGFNFDPEATVSPIGISWSSEESKHLLPWLSVDDWKENGKEERKVGKKGIN